MDDVDAKIAEYVADGFEPYEHETIRPGVRVRNFGERYTDAIMLGTAEVVAVLRKKGKWEADYSRKNIEVLVRRLKTGQLTWWADYGTRLARIQPE